MTACSKGYKTLHSWEKLIIEVNSTKLLKEDLVTDKENLFLPYW